MRGNHRKNNGKYLFITPKTTSEADQRRSNAIKELTEIRYQMRQLASEAKNLQDEIDCLNMTLRQVEANDVYSS